MKFTRSLFSDAGGVVAGLLAQVLTSRTPSMLSLLQRDCKLVSAGTCNLVSVSRARFR